MGVTRVCYYTFIFLNKICSVLLPPDPTHVIHNYIFYLMKHYSANFCSFEIDVQSIVLEEQVCVYYL